MNSTILISFLFCNLFTSLVLPAKQSGNTKVSAVAVNLSNPANTLNDHTAGLHSGKSTADRGTGMMCFIENNGQITDQYGKQRADIQYKLDGGTVTVFVGSGELHYQWAGAPNPQRCKAVKQSTILNLMANVNSAKEKAEEAISTYRMDVLLKGANRNARVTAENEQAYFERYYMGNGMNGGKGIVAHTFKKITYKDIYPHIDWVLYLCDGRMEYDFVVRPGGKVNDIQLEYNGATGLQQDADGSVVCSNPMGSIKEQKPVSYEKETGRPVSSSFRLGAHQLRFETGSYTGTLVIDPQLIWATYYGYNSNYGLYIGGLTPLQASGFGNAINSVVCDASGNVYMDGYTNSTSNIATSGAYSTTLQNGISSYLCSFSASGQILWGTYFNGVVCEGLTYDKNGYLYLTGASDTSMAVNVSTAGAYQTSRNGYINAFLAKFTINGTLQWCTYFGGEGEDCSNDVDCDAAGNVYIVGTTTSRTDVATLGAYQASHSDSNNADVFLAKFSGSGALYWATYLGGSNTDLGLGITCDGSGNVYIAGETNSVDHIATAGSWRDQIPYGSAAGFVSKFNSGGNMLWSTYYGGEITQIRSIKCDPFDNVYFCGWTFSDTGISSPGSHQQYLYSTAGGIFSNAFLAKFDASGNRLWGTYYGMCIGLGRRLACNSKGEVLMAGDVLYAGNISTPGAPQTSNAGSSDAFLCRFSPSGTRLLGTYFGGPGGEYATGIACHDSSSVFLCGSSNSNSGIASVGAYQTDRGSLYSPFLVRYDNDSLYLDNPFPDTVLCQGDTFKVAYYTDIDFASGNVFTVQLSDANGSFANPTTIGILGAVHTDSIRCQLPQVIATGSHYRIRVAASQPRDTSFADDKDIIIKSSPQVTSVTSNSPVCSGDSLGFSISTGGNYIYQWTGPNGYNSSIKNAKRTNITTADSGNYIVMVTGSNNCSLHDTISVTIKPIPANLTADNSGPVCVGSNLLLSSSSTTAGLSYSWAGPGSYSSNAQNPTINNATTAQSGSYTVTATLNGCHSSASTTATVNALNPAPTATITVAPSTSICEAETATFSAAVSNGGSNPAYQWRKNGVDIIGATTAIYTETGQVGNNDMMSCYVTANAACQAVNTVLCNYITMHTVVNAMPTVTVSAFPAVYQPGVTETFTAVITNGNALGLVFQWLKNGTPIGGATASTYASASLAMGDEISLVVHSTIPCTEPDSLVAGNIKLDVSGMTTPKEAFSIYPNPSNGEMIIETPTGHLGGEFAIYSVTGERVYIGCAEPGLRQHISLHVPSGMYMAELINNNGEQSRQRIVIVR